MKSFLQRVHNSFLFVLRICVHPSIFYIHMHSYLLVTGNNFDMTLVSGKYCHEIVYFHVTVIVIIYV